MAPPVFLPITREVIGLRYAGEGGIVGCTLPIDAQRQMGWIRMIEEVLDSRPSSGGVNLTTSGGVVNL